jgi:hypothetical protein
MSQTSVCSWIWLLLVAAQLKGLLAAATAVGPSAVARVHCVSRLKGNFTFQDGSGNQTLTTVPGDVLTMTIVAADNIRTPLRVKWPVSGRDSAPVIAFEGTVGCVQSWNATTSMSVPPFPSPSAATAALRFASGSTGICVGMHAYLPPRSTAPALQCAA